MNRIYLQWLMVSCFFVGVFSCKKDLYHKLAVVLPAVKKGPIFNSGPYCDPVKNNNFEKQFLPC